MASSPLEVTVLLEAWNRGDQAALDQLMPLVYTELRQMARRYMSGQPAGHTLQTTALIHEAYLKLAGQSDVHWQNRSHFFAVAATAMRHILVNHALARKTEKRGGDFQKVSLDQAALVSSERYAELVALDEALTRLAAFDERKSRIVELRYFGGMSLEETADVLKISVETVKRDWRLAKLWLLSELKGASDET
ncbi:MAG TPA: sigma-70 family RNA polymerase sigma factor [Acidobacteriota bacterium]|nr:sigma-70 family RNA polymerase sigma factor [Acidobacteriota bacterium]HNB72380.1 sigma-70 family RNA polymerase sigma factor [Acidobacteriota bacterium]HNC45759.1 sigma-70 family RNA polymerase sigma factor [Acidobacteriota bacterium]HND21115.1 sigma-70 family RNA polymerase sigma factor [Acidobacteriota bacterium]HNG93539.1 sigma-70 family RNA polymerase sigma factor [Acidobacteriota bacterium]